jgi:hypothetical protein
VHAASRDELAAARAQAAALAAQLAQR